MSAANGAAIEALLERSIEEAHAAKGGKQPQGSGHTRGVESQKPEAQALPVELSAVRFSEGELGELFGALALAQAEMQHAMRDSDNPYFKSRYADLASAVDAARIPLTKQGIAVIQLPWRRDQNAVVTTRFGHKSGQWMEADLELTPKDPGPQAFGSAITYARRYAYMAMAGIAPEDDDGNLANGRGESEPAHPQARTNARAFEMRSRERRSPVAARPAVNEEAQATAGIDTGGHPIGTRAAQEYVRDQKIAEGRKSEKIQLSAKSGEIKQAFAQLRERLGEVRYADELKIAGVIDPLRLRSIADVRSLYRKLSDVADQEVS